MSKDIRRVLVEELGRILGEFRRLESQVEQLAVERKRLVTIAQRLLQILRSQAPRGAERLIEELDLADVIARLPGIPGRKPARIARRKMKDAPVAKPLARRGRKAKAVSAVTPLLKGAPVRMLTGKYEGWTGIIRWITIKGTTVAYTVELVSADGLKGRNQVRHGSQGTTWEQIPAGTKASLPIVGGKKRNARLPKRGTKGRKNAVAAPRKKSPSSARASSGAHPIPDVLAKGTAVRLLKGKFKGGTGIIGWTRVNGLSVTYTIYVPGAGGKKDRTQVSQGSLGTSWELAVSPSLIAEKAEPGPAKIVRTVRRRRPGGAPAPTTEVAKGLPPAALPSSSGAAPVSGILAKGTMIRMITGIYLGFTGVIASVRPIPGPKPDAVYTLALKGPGGQKGRTSVKQGSLGRTWTPIG